MRRVRIACGCRTWLFVVLSMAAAASPSVSAEDEGVVIAKASDAAKLAIQGFKAPPGATVELVAAEPELANPVAFCFDEQGRIYVAETFRQDHGVEDDRGHMNWLEDDLSLQTVEQRGEMFRHYLGDKVNDWAKYPERVRRLEDRDGDGRYETATVFASGFNDILDGTGAGVLARRGNVYYTCIPNLWLLRDTDDDGAADVRTVLQHGFGVRTAFRGHDMHGLIWGPDGRLYFSIGDRGYNVETKEGTHLKRPDAGAVFRCEPDGSGLEVYAYGLRNPQELAFNDEGDLFTGDNNSDGGDQARWVYVAPEGDSGWRMYYQYPQDRGPWNRERMWHPYRDDEKTAAVQPAYIVPPIRNFADGPSGVVFDPGVGLPESQRGRFFLVDFRGTPGTSGVRSFRAQPKGAGFQLIDEDWAVQSMLATDVEFGLDGAMYVLDWVDGWTGAGKGRIYRVKFDDGASEQSNVVELFRGGFAKFPDDGLFSLLGHRDRRVRQEAQFELADRAVRQRRERGDAALAEKLLRLAMTGDSPASRHALWATGQVVRLTERPVGSLEELTGSPSAEMRRQAYRIAADAPTSVFGGMSEWHRRAFIKGLSDPEPRVRFMAAIAIARHGDAVAIDPLLVVLAKNQDEDPYLRHAAAVALAGSRDAEELLKRASHPSRAARLGLVLALRRLADPGIAQFLSDGESGIVDEAARAVHDLPIAAALPALAAEVRRPGLAQTAKSASGLEFVRRVVNANFRLGGANAADALAGVAADASFPDGVRREAAQDLLQWAQPPRLDRVTNEFRPIPDRSQSEAEPAVRRVLAGLLSGSRRLRESGIKLAAKYEIRDVGPMLVTLARSIDQAGDVRAQALSALEQLKQPELRQVMNELLTDDEPLVRAEARRVLAAIAPGDAVEPLATAVASPDSSVAERQSAVRVLGGMKNAAADSALERWLDEWVHGGSVPAEIQLELLDAAGSRNTPKLKELATAIEAARPADNPTLAYGDSLVGGDAERGRDVFFGNAAASCRRCHKINGVGSEVGPDLSEIGKQKPRDYLLEAIVNPNAKIAEGFETAVFAMDDGLIHSGVVKGEDEKFFRIMTPQGELILVEKEHVDERAKGQSGMPADLPKQITRRDIRDLVEFLTTLKEKKEASGHE